MGRDRRRLRWLPLPRRSMMSFGSSSRAGLRGQAQVCHASVSGAGPRRPGLVPYITLMREDAQQRGHRLRDLFNGLRYVIRYGIAWRAMPNGLPPWSAVYQQPQCWLAAGCFEALAHDLRAVLRLVTGRAEEPPAALIDSRTLRSTSESGPRAGCDGAKPNRPSRTSPACSAGWTLLATRRTGSLMPNVANHENQ